MPVFASHKVFADVHAITTGRRHGRPARGGGGSYAKLRGDLLRWMKQDGGTECWFTSMIDLYRLPADFPGLAACAGLADGAHRVACLETRWVEDIAAAMPEHPAARRFIPYLQLHEFEALLFADPAAFLDPLPGHGAEVRELAKIRAACGGPEAVDEGPNTAPSRRIARLFPAYEKVVSGVLVAQRIGLPVLRRECPHFDAWVTRILGLVPADRVPDNGA